MQADERYREVLERARGDPGVLGLVLAGGRGKGVFAEGSDYDIAVIVADEAPEAVAEGYRGLNVREVIDIQVLTLAAFARLGAWGSHSAWAAYGFAHLAAALDRSGEVQRILDQKGKIPPDQVGGHVERALDAFINQYYRALKNRRDGNLQAARLDAAESVPLLLEVLFGLEGRVRPYNKFLRWELERYPLRRLAWSAGELLRLVGAVIENGEMAALAQLYGDVRQTALDLGFTQTIARWEGYRLD